MISATPFVNSSTYIELLVKFPLKITYPVALAGILIVIFPSWSTVIFKAVTFTSGTLWVTSNSALDLLPVRFLSPS